MKWAFWISVALVAYTYFGYPLWLWVRMHWRARPLVAGAIEPSVSVIIAVHNGEKYIGRKLNNILTKWAYPPEKIEVLVVSDGSTDGTDAILRSQTDPRVQALFSSERQGKAAALNRAVPLAKGEIVVFTDVRQLVEPDGVRHIVSRFADPTVGCVSGQLMLGELTLTSHADGDAFKWAVENKTREWEGATNSVVGALGAFYAVRRELIVPIPPGTILDDCYVPLNVVRAGSRTVFEGEARAWDDIKPTFQQEFRRKVRTITGNYQLVRLMPWLLTWKNPVLFEFISHKLLRLIVPFAQGAIFVLSALIPGHFYHAIFIAQLVVFALALIGVFLREGGIVSRGAAIALTLVVLNVAAVVALLNFVRRKENVWAA